MTIFFANWLAVIAIGLVAVVTPGPDFLLTLRSSLTYSKQTGIYTAIGIGVGNLIHASYSLIGIGALVSRSILLFNMLKILGALYLIYLGVHSIITAKNSHANDNSYSQKNKNSRKIDRWKAFKIGLFGNMLNPKATLFFLALFTQVISPSTSVAVQAIYGSTIAVLALIWFSLVALLISHKFIRKGLMASSHWMERVTGVALIALGLRLAFSRSE